MSIRSRLLTLLGIAGVSASNPSKAQTEPEPVHFEFALYFAPAPKEDPEAILTRLLADEFQHVSAFLFVTHEWYDLADYAPPTPQAFRYTAVELDVSQGAAIAESERVFVLGFAAHPADLLRAHREANTLTLTLAEASEGLPWDEECRLLYSREAWQRKRVENWQGDVPDVRGHVNMHAYRNPDLVRIITLGMRKFGLPDLVVEATPSGKTQVAGNVVNACAQRMLEGQPFDGERFKLVLADIRHDAMRANALENPLEGATGKVAMQLAECARDEGDPENRLLAISFPEAKGRDDLERQATALAALYGAKEVIVNRWASDQALKAASNKARADFFAQVDTFRKGFHPNERLTVKVPFTFDGQTEYMWVEVVGWGEETMDGILMNDSSFEESFRVGRKLTVKFEDVYDYIHTKSDGTESGNETGKVLGYN